MCCISISGHQRSVSCLRFPLKFTQALTAEGFPGGSVVKDLPAKLETQETEVQSLGLENPPKKEMAIHSSSLAWEIPRTEEPEGLQSIVLKRVGHN